MYMQGWFCLFACSSFSICLVLTLKLHFNPSLQVAFSATVNVENVFQTVVSKPVCLENFSWTTAISKSANVFIAAVLSHYLKKFILITHHLLTRILIWVFTFFFILCSVVFTVHFEVFLISLGYLEGWQYSLNTKFPNPLRFLHCFCLSM